MRLKTLLTLPLLVASLKAASVSDLTFTLIDDGNEYSVSGCDHTASGSLDIPSTYNGLPVTSIGNGAFYNCTSLSSITIPDSVTSIGNQALSRLFSLTSITIPDSVTSIGDYAFNGSRLTSITIGDGVTSIGDYAFRECISLTSIAIPDSVTSIGVGVFFGCTSLTSITIPNSVTSIGKDAFASCTSVTSITIGNSVTSIGNGAFANCTSLTNIAIPDSVTSIGSTAFYSCSNLTSITIPDSVASIGGFAFSSTGLSFSEDNNSIKYLISASGNTAYLIDGSSSSGNVIVPSTLLGASVASIGSGAFRICTNLTSITIPDSVTSIGKDAFASCTSVTSITIGNSVTSIGGWAFANCTSLTNIAIPDSVTSIGDGAFQSCNNLSSITFVGDAPTFGTNVFLYSNSVTVYYHGDATGFTSPTWQGVETNIISQTDTDGDGIDDAQELSDSFQYELIEGNYSFLDAKADAVNRGGRLAILDSSEKVSSAESVLLNNNSYIWIGLERAGNQWRWINGSLLDDDIANWASNEPNNVGGREDYVEIYGQNLYWNDDDENEQKSYLIEYSSYITDPNLADSDGDGLTDGEEFSVYYTNPTISDTDGDEINDGDEVLSYSTNPNLEDTSGDGLGDGVVVNAGFDPTVDYSNLVISSRQGMTNLRPGSTIIQVTNNEASIQIQMEESSDLESWSEIGDAATMVVPADTNTKFYRFKMTE